MKLFFVTLISCYLVVVTTSTASSRYTKDKNKIFEEDDTVGLGVNSTAGPDQREYSESGSRREIVPPTHGCYTKFFIEDKPPTGFRPNSPYIKHICQQIYDYSKDTLYATMFDENIGIAVYAAYVVKYTHIPLMGTFPRISKWIQNPGIARQGSNQMYEKNGQNIDKGHLVPASTYAFDCIAMVSTFRFTNAVPQYNNFNRNQWSQYEKKVREFASEVCRPKKGDLYLLTGTSEAKLLPGGPPPHAHKQALKHFPHNNNRAPNIVIPNSMWTAGCCVNQQGVVGGFAVIGNNDQNNPVIQQVTVEELQKILAIGIGMATIELFPGGKSCSNAFFQYRHQAGRGWGIHYH